MDEMIIVKQTPYFFVPENWIDTFKDSVVESYISIIEMQVTYDSHLPEIPYGFHLTEEDEIILLCDKMTCDIEYGVEYVEEIIFESEDEYDAFALMCHENLNLLIYDINKVLEHYRMPYQSSGEFRNMPIKGVW